MWDFVVLKLFAGTKFRENDEKLQTPQNLKPAKFNTFKVSLKLRKLLVVTTYRPLDQNLDYFLSSITAALDHYLQYFEDFSILADFIEREHNPKMQSFLSQQGCKNIIKNKTCFKSMEGSSIDVILSSRPNLHQHTRSNLIRNERSPSDDLYNVLSSTYTKLEPTVLRKRPYKNLSKESLLKDLKLV